MSLAMVLTASGCTTLPAISNSYARCGLDSNEWKLLSTKPKNAKSLIDSLDLRPRDKIALLFLGQNGNIIYCRASKDAHYPNDTSSIACGSSQFEYKRSGDTWSNINPSGEPTVTVCGGQ